MSEGRYLYRRRRREEWDDHRDEQDLQTGRKWVESRGLCRRGVDHRAFWESQGLESD